ncbi:carboxylate-amine ligase [Actinoplanes awajinensis]|uniref:carboxylate-amine ligase n=1 Tax=Actinoplanes awajinensis TaxID=135946 RepID=UPI000A00D8F0|nr:glutamate--cysteine ligase [Actinoplanes awajinensis]
MTSGQLPNAAAPGTAPGGDPLTAPTFGVEEEFLLLDPIHGRPVPAAPAVLRMLRNETGPRAELMNYQVETATAVCTGTDELGAELRRLRALAAEAARARGCRLVATAVAPYGAPALSAITDAPRYHGLAARHPTLTALSGVCACQVHVGVPSRDLGAQVLTRLRPWLATLLAISANSPFTGGHDTGYASHRYDLVSQWPTARPPDEWRDAADYDRAVQRLLRRGAAMDERSIYFLARLSPRYPTVEVRVADTCLDRGTTLLLAALVRALVVTATADVRAGLPPPPAAPRWVIGSLLAAAHNGLAGPGIDPFTGDAVPAWDLVSVLVGHVGAALAALGDTATVATQLARLREHGTGAERQRRLWKRAATPFDIVAGLAAITDATD